jgi:hypothetical protein
MEHQDRGSVKRSFRQGLVEVLGQVEAQDLAYAEHQDRQGQQVLMEHQDQVEAQGLWKCRI